MRTVIETAFERKVIDGPLIISEHNGNGGNIALLRRVIGNNQALAYLHGMPIRNITVYREGDNPQQILPEPGIPLKVSVMGIERLETTLRLPGPCSGISPDGLKVIK